MNRTLSSLQTLASKNDKQIKSEPSFILISSEMQHTRKIKKQISDSPLVIEVTEVGGMYDLIVKIESNSIKEIKEIVANKIRTIVGVRTCITLFGFDPNYKKSNYNYT